MSTRRRLTLALMLSSGVAVLEFWGGAISHSLALTTDAVHVCMDVFAFGIALLAALGAQRRANRRKTFGYGRIEVLGALANSAILLGATAILAYQAVLRFRAPVEPHGLTMTIVAAIGLAVNVSTGLILSGQHHVNHNLRAALTHVLGDSLGASAVIVGGVLIAVTGAAWIDPLLSLFVAAIIVIGVARVLRDASEVLLEATPPGIDTAEVEARIRAIGGVLAVHDLHVWTIGSGSHALSAHLLLDEGQLSFGGRILELLRRELAARYGIGHVTIQLETEHCDPGGIIICRSEEA
ncbi:MAG TPA: cation diffusion facilitator family transporter [Candidatus Baltobacteraceae bacterium]|nr:cation diffusion facilitator family transporter [Candidatus Baltobacteraceae bacterium]